MARKSSIDSRLHVRIESFVDEISAIVRESAVEAVHDALIVGGAPRAAARKVGRRRKIAKAVGRKKRGGRRLRRTAADLEKLGASIMSHVRSNPGHRLEQIGAGLSVATSDLKRPVFLLMGTKKLRTTGQRRGTKYFAGKGGAPKVAKKKTAKKKKAAKQKNAK